MTTLATEHQQLRAEPRWLFYWVLGPGREAPLLGSNLSAVPRTGMELMERPVQEAAGGCGAARDQPRSGVRRRMVLATPDRMWRRARVGVDLRDRAALRAR